MMIGQFINLQMKKRSKENLFKNVPLTNKKQILNELKLAPRNRYGFFQKI